MDGVEGDAVRVDADGDEHAPDDHRKKEGDKTDEELCLSGRLDLTAQIAESDTLLLSVFVWAFSRLKADT